MADNRPPGSRNDPETRKGSVLLSGLMLTPDDALEVFRDRRAADPSLDPIHMKRARDILDALQLAISDKDPERWQRIAQAWQALCSNPAWLARPTRAPLSKRVKQQASSEEPTKRERLNLAPAGAAGKNAPGSLGAGPNAPAADTRAAEHPHPDTAGNADDGESGGPDGEPQIDRKSSPSASPPPAPALALPGVPVVAPLAPRPSKSPWTSPTLAAERATAARAAGPPDPQAPPPRVQSPPVPPPRIGPPPSPSTPTSAEIAALAGGNASLAAFAAMVQNEDGGTVVGPGLQPSGPVLPFVGTETPPHGTPGTRPRSDTAPPPAMANPWDEQAHTEVTSKTVSPLAPALPFSNPEENQDAEATIARGTSFAAWLNTPPAERTGPAPEDARPALPPHLAAIDVEGYAALCAQCQVWPSFMSEIHASFGIASHAERSALDDHWRARLGSDSALAESFQWHRDRHEQWERQRGQ